MREEREGNTYGYTDPCGTLTPSLETMRPLTLPLARVQIQSRTSFLLVSENTKRLLRSSLTIRIGELMNEMSPVEPDNRRCGKHLNLDPEALNKEATVTHQGDAIKMKEEFGSSRLHSMWEQCNSSLSSAAPISRKRPQ
jgi:hypothetical protein